MLYQRFAPIPRHGRSSRTARHDGVVTEEEVKQFEQEVMEGRSRRRTPTGAVAGTRGGGDAPAPRRRSDGRAVGVADALNERLLTWPETLHVHPRLAKQLERRREAMGEAGGIDWGHAESLAFASLS
jgi:2-oxoglutarate dehydrogenase E1 component